jgi:pyruvate kinase
LFNPVRKTITSLLYLKNFGTNDSFQQNKDYRYTWALINGKSVVRQMIEAGADVFRLNFSHISHQKALEAIVTVRDLNDELGTTVALLADLQGPKLRVGKVEEGGIVLKKGKEIRITTQQLTGNSQCISVSYENLAADVRPFEQILIDDGNITLEIISTDGVSEVTARVVYGGLLTSNKGFNLPRTNVSLPCLTEKDLEDLRFALEHHIEWIGLSFVRSASDVIELKHLISNADSESKVIAKIEKPEAVEDIDAIVTHTDAVMIARGDLGVEMDLEKVPMIQKKIVKLCMKQAKPVIIATQMMQSMIESPIPFRAEVNDVANAVFDGADALMLSGETSIGKYPVKTVETMMKIISEIEDCDEIFSREMLPERNRLRFITDSVCFNACKLAARVDAKVISVMTNSGYSAFRIASMRPKAAVVAFTANKHLLTALNLVWGVRCYYYDKTISTDHTIEDIQYFLKRMGLASKGDLVIHTASMPIHEMGMTNTLRLSELI